MRDDLLLSQLAVPLCSLCRNALWLLQPGSQVFSDRLLRRIDRRPRVHFGEQPSQFSLSLLLGPVHRDVPSAAFARSGVAVTDLKLEAPAIPPTSRDMSTTAHSDALLSS